jgi:hypothetical protein
VKTFYLASSQLVLDGHQPLIDAINKGSFLRKFFVADLRKDKDVPLDLSKFTSQVEVLNEGQYVVQLASNHTQIFSVPYLEHYSHPDLLESNARKIYCGYAPVWSYDTRLHFELEFYKAMDYLFTTSSNADDGFVRSGVSSIKLVRIKDPTLAYLTESSTKSVDLLWTPHWTQSWFGFPNGYSSFIWATSAILEYASNNPDKSVVIRAHPFLSRVISDFKMRGLIPESPYGLAIADWERLLALPNVNNSSNTIYGDILKAKLIITDPSTIMIYAAYAGANSAICYSESSPPLSSLGSLALQSSFKIENSDDLINHLNNSQDNLAFKNIQYEARRMLVDELTLDRDDISLHWEKFHRRT